MKNRVEAEFRRRTFVGVGMDGDVKTVVMGWLCECGGEIGPNCRLMKCVACQGMIVKQYDPQMAIAQDTAFLNAALAWT